MNIAFFLLPKEKVAYVADTDTMRQALEKMEYHSYSAIPIINKHGNYVGTLTEGDLLWKLKNDPNLNFQNMHKIPLIEVKKNRINLPVHINAEMEDMLGLAVSQNFVPVVDDQQVFIGIIRRQDIIEYFKSMNIKKTTN
ncbi:CBS domain-containing protein [Guptibacillus spartinae]|uniref:CBS domain-containing protein n=1 Tax=Guptibacillus spartinae TaxID=3025679 RepID=UPI00235EBE67|nr:CBS domain-containing protein [Pseudalkalibacillus spartinae]